MIMLYFCATSLLHGDSTEPKSENLKKRDPFKDNYTKYIPDFMKERERQRHQPGRAICAQGDGRDPEIGR